MTGQDMAPSSKHTAEPVVALGLDPPLLADLLRRQLSDHGVIVAAASTTRRADVVVVNGPGPPVVAADVVVRLHDGGHLLPAMVEIESEGVGVSRVADIDDVEQLIDLLVAVTLEPGRS